MHLQNCWKEDSVNMVKEKTISTLNLGIKYNNYKVIYYLNSVVQLHKAVVGRFYFLISFLCIYFVLLLHQPDAITWILKGF